MIIAASITYWHLLCGMHCAFQVLSQFPDHWERYYFCFIDEGIEGQGEVSFLRSHTWSARFQTQGSCQSKACEPCVSEKQHLPPRWVFRWPSLIVRQQGYQRIFVSSNLSNFIDELQLYILSLKTSSPFWFCTYLSRCFQIPQCKGWLQALTGGG